MHIIIDTRFGADTIKSRAGLETSADILINSETNLLESPAEMRDVHCVLVDEAQFLDPLHIDQLRAITLLWNVPVICYGLRTDFRSNLFPGSKRLMEVADTIEEVRTATINVSSVLITAEAAFVLTILLFILMFHIYTSGEDDL